jgi:hypothetical protein
MQDKSLNNLISFFNKFKSKQLEILEERNKDYCNTDNAIKGFEEIALLTGLPITQVFSFLINLKVQRLNNGLQSNNNLTDTITDLINYLQLFAFYLNLQGEFYFTDEE